MSVNGISITRSEDAAQTYRLSADSLFDFCAGFAAMLWREPADPPN
jgi:hypothetical protein